jgi:hypothetical protein
MRRSREGEEVMERFRFAVGFLVAFACAGAAVFAAQEAGTVVREQKIALGAGGFAGPLDDEDRFGGALAALGDVDGDGIGDLAAGAPADDDGGRDRGAVWILFANADGTVRGQQKISGLSGGFLGALSNFDRFGVALAALGDLDGDGIEELAVGAEQDDDGGSDRGAVWVLFLDADGTVRAERKISQGSSGFAGPLGDDDHFGRSLARVGDLDGDGRSELAVGAYLDDDGGPNRGAAWILFLEADASVRAQVKLSAAQGGLAGPLLDGDRFGAALAALGDLAGDGTVELAVGADQDDEGAQAAGAVWILSLGPDGRVVAQMRLGASAGLALADFDRLGSSLAAVGDVDGDGVCDLAAGATGDDDGGLNRGAVWILLLRSDGALAGWRKISSTAGNLAGPLANGVSFGGALSALGDHDGDGMLDLATGAEGDDQGGTNRGAFWTLFLHTAVVAPSLVIRNGSGINPILLTAEHGPRTGQTWLVQVDCRLTGNRHLRRGGLVIHHGVDTPDEGHVYPRIGERLIAWRRPRIFWAFVRHHGNTVTIPYGVPADPALVGLAVYSQAILIGGRVPELTNALDAWVRD